MVVRILLVSANRLAEPYPVYPIGLDYVRGALLSRHQVDVLDMAVEPQATSLEERLQSFQPELVGLALRNIDNTEAADTRTFIREYRDLVQRIRGASAAPLVLGGAAFTIAPGPMIEALGAEYGIVGEGERLLDLADALSGEGDISSVPGLWVGDAASAASTEGDPARCAATSSPAPLGRSPRRALPEPGPQLDHYLDRSGMMNLQTQRGCPFSCVYCTYPQVEGGRLRPIPAQEVAEDALALQRLGARYLFVTDAVYNADEEHGLAVASAFRRVGLTIPWGAYFSPRTTDPAYWRELAASGLTHVEFGTDSLDDGVLGQYHKPFRRQGAQRSHEAALDAGLWVAHFFTLGGPGETPETVQSTFEAARSLRRCVCFFFVGVRVYPGTPLAEDLPGEGALPEGGLTPVFFEPPGWSLAELQEVADQVIRPEPGWFLGSGGPRMARAISRLHRMGHTGPLWERLVR